MVARAVKLLLNANPVAESSVKRLKVLGHQVVRWTTGNVTRRKDRVLSQFSSFRLQTVLHTTLFLPDEFVSRTRTSEVGDPQPSFSL